MRKNSTLLTRKHVNPTRTSLFLMALASFLFAGSPAAAQSISPYRLAAQASYAPETAKAVVPTSETVKEDGEEGPVTVSVSPNPTSGKFLVSLKGEKEDRVRIKVTDRHGCVVDNHELSGGSSLQLGYWYFPGTYQMHIIQGNNTKTIKLEKQLE